ncbi:hypothetical protein D6821_01485, partial [Candidatus Parcubacteria bacterium]
IKGMHCQSCKVLLEEELTGLKGVKKTTINYPEGDCQIHYDEEKVSPRLIYQTIKNLNYKIETQEKTTNQAFKGGWKIALSSVFLVGLAYFFINYLNLWEVLGYLNEEKISYWLIFLIGILASFHCVGMCGGLVVAYTTRHHSQSVSRFSVLPHWQYNLGRLISYGLVGGVLGGFGSFFGINPNFTGAMTLVAGFLMVLMGLALIAPRSWLAKIQLKTPNFMARYLYRQRQKRSKGPFVVGLLNVFMPCGPLQAMQLYALSTGSIVEGFLAMGIYALGTIPLMFGFGNLLSLLSQEKIKQAIKFSGIMVIVLGGLMFNRGLISFGYGLRSFIPRQAISQQEYLIKGEVKEYQVAKMDLTYRGYSPNVLYIRAGIPVRWIITVKEMSGCTDEIIVPDLKIRRRLEYGENIIEFTPPKNKKEIKFSCWMKMVWGKFIVVEKGAPLPTAGTIENLSQPSSTCSGGGACGGTCGSTSCGCRRLKAR